jgi:serine/threonine-protein kinase
VSNLSLPLGTSVAGYRVEKVIGSGGMGIVYEATQLSLDRRVALKVLAPHVSEDDEYRERFRREGALQASVDDSRIVTVYEAGESELGLYIAMRLVRGRNLKEILLTGDVPVEGILKIVEQIAGALDSAHTAGLIHRDVKPQNVLVEEATGKAFLADFGLTKASGQRSLTRAGAYVGSLDYVSPEQIRDETITPASDVYSLAAVLFEALSGNVPYPRDTEAAILFAHLSDPPPPLSSFRPELAGLDPILERGLSKSPEDRYPTASEMVEEAKRTWVRLLTDRALAAERALHESEVASTDRRSETVIDRLPAAAKLSIPVVGVEKRFPVLPILGAVAFFGLIGLGAFALGHVTTSVRNAKLTKIPTGQISFHVPPGWSRGTITPEAARNLGLKKALIRLKSTEGAKLVAGTTQLSDSAWLPEEVGTGPRVVPTLVRLGTLEAYRFRAVSVTGFDQKATYYLVAAIPHGVGVVCFGDSPTARASMSCAGVAATLKLKGLRVVAPPGPDKALATTTSRLLASLALTSKRDLKALRRSRTATQEATHARALERAFDTASHQVREVGANGDRANAERIAAKLHKIAKAYNDLRKAARPPDLIGYRQARKRIQESIKELIHVVGSLNAKGYAIA